MAMNGDSGVRTPLLNGVSSTSPTSGTGSVVLPSSTVLEPPNQRRSRWWSIRVMYLTMFMSAVTFTLTMSTIWPYLKVVDETATPSFLGWVVASYSLGQLIASPLFGSWSARQSARQPLLVSLFLQVGSNLFYAYVQSIPANGGDCLIVARIVMGFAAGNAAVVRAYVSAATTVEERTGTMSKVSLFQSIGFILGPIIQTALVYVGYPGPVEKNWLHFNMYTSPAIFAALFTVVNFVLVLLFFRLHTVSDSTVINTTLHGDDKEEGEEKGEEERRKTTNGRPDYRAVALSIYLFSITFFVFTIFETIGTALTMDMYGWSKEEASKYIGYTLGGASCIAIVVFLVVAKKGKDERIMLLVGFSMCLIGFFTFVSWGHDLPALSYAPIYTPTTRSPHDAIQNTTHPVSDFPWQEGYQITEQQWSAMTVTQTADSTPTNSSFITTTLSENVTTAFSNWTTDSNISPTTADSTASSAHTHTLTSTLVSHVTTASSNWTTESPTTAAHNSTGKTTTVAPEGCPWYFAWCNRVPKIQLWQFFVGTFFISIGYPMCNAMTYSIYSKVLGDKPQGLWMGIITASGSLARMLGPVFVAQIYDSFGPRVTFSCTCGVLALTMIINIVGWRRLVPYSESPYRRRGHLDKSVENNNGVGTAGGSLQ